MLRSTAKNHAFTCIVTSPQQYGTIQEEIAAKGGTYDGHHTQAHTQIHKPGFVGHVFQSLMLFYYLVVCH
jgi:hypothetical protein